MRIRCIVLLPLAAVVTGLLLLLTSSIASNLTSSLSSSLPTVEDELVRHETECESLRRRIEEVTRNIQACEALPGCLRSENLCPASIQEEFAAQYEGLRRTAGNRCSELQTPVTRVAAACDAGPTPSCVANDCGVARSDEGWNLLRAEPATYLF